MYSILLHSLLHLLKILARHVGDLQFLAVLLLPHLDDLVLGEGFSGEVDSTHGLQLRQRGSSDKVGEPCPVILFWRESDGLVMI